MIVLYIYTYLLFAVITHKISDVPDILVSLFWPIRVALWCFGKLIEE